MQALTSRFKVLFLLQSYNIRLLGAMNYNLSASDKT